MPTTVKRTRKRNPSSLPATISIAMVLVMVGLFMLITLSAKKVSDYLLENIELSVYIYAETPGDSIQLLKTRIDTRPEVKSSTYIDKETASRQFTEEIGQDFVNVLGSNPLLPSINLLLKSEFASQSSMLAIKQELLKNQMVKEVVYQPGLLEEVEKNTQVIGVVILGLSAVFLLIAITLINSTVRLELYSSRFLIRSMQLVGATRWFIIRPFLGKAIKNGFYGVLIAALLLAGFIYTLLQNIPELQQITSVQEFAVIGGVILILGVLLTMVCSYFATSKYLKLKLEELY